MKVLPALLLSLLPVVASARVQPAQPAIPAQPGFRAEFMANLDDTQQKLVSLAEATPASKFTWRPARDIRSISEVYMHIAGSNDFLSSFAGGPAPKNTGIDPEKTVTSKAEVVAELKKSFERLRAFAAKTDDLDTPVKMFGTQTTKRGVLLTILTHLHEHLGQSIAYARMNGIVPPWSH